MRHNGSDKITREQRQINKVSSRKVIVYFFKNFQLEDIVRVVKFPTELFIAAIAVGELQRIFRGRHIIELSFMGSNHPIIAYLSFHKLNMLSQLIIVITVESLLNFMNFI